MVLRDPRLDRGAAVDPRTAAFRRARAGKLFASFTGSKGSDQLGSSGRRASTEGGPEPQRRVGRKLSRAFLRSHGGARSSPVRFSRPGPAGVLKVDRSAAHPRIGLPSRSPMTQASQDPRTSEQAASALGKRWRSPSLSRSTRPRLGAPAGRVRPRPSPVAVATASSSRRIGFVRAALPSPSSIGGRFH